MMLGLLKETQELDSLHCYVLLATVLSITVYRKAQYNPLCFICLRVNTIQCNVTDYTWMFPEIIFRNKIYNK